MLSGVLPAKASASRPGEGLWCEAAERNFIADIAGKLKDREEDGASWETLNRSARTPTPHSAQMALKRVYRQQKCELCWLTGLGAAAGNQWRKSGFMCRPHESQEFILLSAENISC